MSEQKKYPRISDGLTLDDIWNMGREGVVCRYCKGELVSHTGQQLRRKPDFLFELTYLCLDCRKRTIVRLVVDA